MGCAPVVPTPGFPPGIGQTVKGGVFTDRCALARAVCRERERGLDPGGEPHSSRCHFSDIAQTLPRAEKDMVPRQTVPKTARAVLSIQNLRRTMRQQAS